MLKRFNIYKIMSSRKKDISNEMNQDVSQLSDRCQVIKCKSNDESQICRRTRNDFENSWEFQQEQKNYKYSWWLLSEDLLLVNYRDKKRSQSEISLTWIFKAFSIHFFLCQSNSLNSLPSDLAHFFLHQSNSLNLLSLDLTRLFEQWNLSNTAVFPSWN